MWAVFAFAPPPSGLGLGIGGAVQWMRVRLRAHLGQVGIFDL